MRLMNRLLLGYSPDLDLFDEAPPDVLAEGSHAVASGVDSTGQALALLQALTRPPRLRAWLERLLQRAADSPLEAPLAAELAALLQGAALRVLPQPRPFGRKPGALAQAGRFFDVELEGLSPEDREFEIARRFVLLAVDAARQAARSPRPQAPQAAARRAAARAARRFAPGWLRSPSPVRPLN
jgi:hypothetical protein